MAVQETPVRGYHQTEFLVHRFIFFVSEICDKLHSKSKLSEIVTNKNKTLHKQELAPTDRLEEA